MATSNDDNLGNDCMLLVKQVLNFGLVAFLDFTKSSLLLIKL
jgi:hypothetical protein